VIVKNKIRSRDKDIGASSQTNFLKKAQLSPKFYETSGSSKLIFDFGLILQQSTVHYAGLLCVVSVKHTRKRLGKMAQSHDETLAFGGRFDNNVANF